MKITKLGHCALILEDKGVRILTDPGSFTTDAQEKETELDIILITHEHQDHFHVESVQKLLEKNPDVQIVTNASVAKLLKEKGIVATIVGDGQSATVKGVVIEGFGKDHAEIYGEMGLVENTGYFVNGTFYFPGDNFHEPGKDIDVLALPVAGPWMKISEAIKFAKTVKAKKAFGVHDGMIVSGFRGFVYMLLGNLVPDTQFTEIKDGETKDF